jgi:predicted SAM-dependent methyltransferase
MLRFLKRLPFLRNPGTRRALRRIPGILQIRHAAANSRRKYYRFFGQRWLKRKLAASESKRIVIGAWSKFDPGWIPTQEQFLDLTDPAQWRVYFEPNSVDAMLAEHVWEHISPEEGLAAAKTCYTYLKPGAALRIAVPDGLLPDPGYVDMVKADALNPTAGNAPDAGGNAANHKALYTYKTLKALFERAGFRVVLYEYFDEQGAFHCQDWDAKGGTITRSKRFDPRNKNGRLASVYPGTMDEYLAYSSLILDAVKESTPGPG